MTEHKTHLEKMMLEPSAVTATTLDAHNHSLIMRELDIFKCRRYLGKAIPQCNRFYLCRWHTGLGCTEGTDKCCERPLKHAPSPCLGRWLSESVSLCPLTSLLCCGRHAVHYTCAGSFYLCLSVSRPVLPTRL